MAAQLLVFGLRRKLHPVLQAEQAECGLACLAMLLQFHGSGMTLQQLRSEHPGPDVGVNLQKLMGIARTHQLAPRALRLELDELKDLELPCVLHWDYNHYVVLERVSQRRCKVIDPALGRRDYPLTEVSQHFTGIALELTPGLNFSPAAPPPEPRLRQFIPSRSALSAYLGKVVALSVVLQGLALLSPYYIQTVVDDVLSRGDADFLLVLALGFALVVTLEVVLAALRSWTGTLFGQRLAFSMAAGLFDRLLRLPLGWFATRHTGDISSRFSSFESLRSFLTQGVAFSIIDGAMAICFVVIMWLYAPSLTLVVLGSVALYLLLRLAMYEPQRAANAEHLVTSAKQSGLFLESIKQINSLKSNGGEATRQQLWELAYSREVNTAMRIARLGLTFSQSQALLFGLENILVIYLGAQLIIDGPVESGYPLTIGMLYAFIAYKNQFKSRVAGLVNNLIEYRLLGVHLERLSDITQSEPEALRVTEALPAPVVDQPLLLLEGVGYRYPDRPPLLANINLNLQQGDSLAIGGPSGCGKSTLLRLIGGLTPATEGEIWLEGRSIQESPLSIWRSMIACVTQEDGLFAGTIADNVTMFSAVADESRLQQAADLTGLADMIEVLPLRWDTQLGELGIALSAGQQQRVLLARALYRDAQLLILDEATAHLDAAAETRILHNLRAAGRSFIVVSHRASVHEFADHSITLDSGASSQQPGLANQHPGTQR